MKLFTSTAVMTRFVLAAIVAVTSNVRLTNAVDGYGPLPSEVAVGDEICVYGFVMDEWCIIDVSVIEINNITPLFGGKTNIKSPLSL
jgi:hypothetical protein